MGRIMSIIMSLVTHDRPSSGSGAGASAPPGAPSAISALGAGVKHGRHARLKPRCGLKTEVSVNGVAVGTRVVPPPLTTAVPMPPPATEAAS